MLAYEADRRPTQHYQARAAERALPSNVEDFLLTWGTETRAAGATHITLVRRDLPRLDRDVALANAPKSVEGFFAIPKVIGAA